MDAIFNPYSPGAGVRPPELAGRDDVIDDVLNSINRLSKQRSAQCPILVGLRGVGKTVLLNHLYRAAISSNAVASLIEAPEGKSLPVILIPRLREMLLSMSARANVSDKLTRAMSALRNFMASWKIKYENIELSLPGESADPGLADSGDLDNDLAALLETLGEVALEQKRAVVIFVDEMQFIPENELGSLIAAIHRCGQLDLPIAIVGAGLPQLYANAGRAKSYSERLFKFHIIDRLDERSARQALVKPAEKEGVYFTSEAIDEVISLTQRYPYFIQEWGDKCWRVAPSSPITLIDVEHATALAVQHLDSSFFAVRFDRCSPLERNYMRAVAELGDEAVRSGAVADLMARTSQQLAPTRSSLIKKGMIYSPAHGDAAFTVPLFAAYMRRRIPRLELPRR
jgi:AAA ATPase domain